MQPQKSYRRYREIADNIAHRIAAGDYAPGERLPSERELVEEMGVSRPTIREALIALEIMGYVAVRGGSGIYVVGAGQAQPKTDLGIGTFELLEARKIIEADVAGIAASTITNEQLIQLRNFVEQQIKGHERKSDLFDTADKQFHIFIAKVSGNGALLYIVEELWKFRRESDIWRMLDERLDSEALQARAIDDHIKICAALETRDPEAATRAMHEHIQNNIEWRLSNYFEVPATSDIDRRIKLRLRLNREVERQKETRDIA